MRCGESNQGWLHERPSAFPLVSLVLVPSLVLRVDGVLAILSGAQDLFQGSLQVVLGMNRCQSCKADLIPVLSFFKVFSPCAIGIIVKLEVSDIAVP